MQNDDKELSELIGRHATRHRASPALQSSVRTEVALQAAAGSRERKASKWGRWDWRFGGLGFASGVFATLICGLVFLRTGVGPDIEGEVVASHVRALMVAHLTDVESSDRHTVKPWFQGKLDYSPPVPDFASAGFPLVGGRLDYVADRTVAALIYRRHQHVINVFVWPNERGGRVTIDSRQGFNVAHWQDAGMQYWAVSDVNAGELQQLGDLWRNWSSAHAAP